MKKNYVKDNISYLNNMPPHNQVNVQKSQKDDGSLKATNNDQKKFKSCKKIFKDL